MGGDRMTKLFTVGLEDAAGNLLDTPARVMPDQPVLGFDGYILRGTVADLRAMRDSLEWMISMAGHYPDAAWRIAPLDG